MRYLAFFLSVCLLSLAPVAAVEMQPHADKAAEAIKWQGWSDHLFERARAEHKLVILDLEAVWCHWCHVMDERTYSNPGVRSLLNQHFIAVRVDQDSRPDLSNKYEEYGWPATIIFNAEGQELVKRAGYIPPEEMRALLDAVVKDPTPGPSARQENTASIKYSADSVLSEALRKELIARHVNGYDTENGAWSHGQKFLEPDSVEYALTMAKAGNTREAKMARQTLDQQIHLLDPVWGGMYQYSTHDDWRHPHFEKIMSVQADNMRVYSLGYLLFHEQRYLTTAESIYRYLTTFLLSPEGAFYTSQDADVVPGKHSSDYFALSDKQRRARGIPRIDKHIYARENGWAISGLLALYKATGDKRYLDSAERAANWIVAHRSLGGGGFSHDEKDSAGPYLGDTLYMGRAMLGLYEATGNQEWLKRASEAADFIGAHFRESDNTPGFLTAQPQANVVPQPVALLDENVNAARFFNLLSKYSAKDEYKKLADSAMRYLATPAIAHKRSIFVAGILLADKETSSDPVHITIVGAKADPQALALFKEALRYPVSYKQVEWYDKKSGGLPDAELEFPDLEKAAAFACAAGRCSAPIFQPQAIAKTVDSFFQGGQNALRSTQ